MTWPFTLLTVAGGIVFYNALAQWAGRQFKTINHKLDKIMANENEVINALSLIDAATNKIGANVASAAEVGQKISDEIDEFLKGVRPGTVITDEQLAQLKDLGTRSQTASEALDAQVVVLNAIASKGATNPVPIPVPPLGTDVPVLEQTPASLRPPRPS